MLAYSYYPYPHSQNSTVQYCTVCSHPKFMPARPNLTSKLALRQKTFEAEIWRKRKENKNKEHQ